MKTLASVLLIVLAASPLHGQDRVREDVVVTAHAEDVPFETLARDVVVITREDIARLPGRSIADLLAYVGVDVRSRGPWGVQSDFSLRGATFGQALVLVDGVRLNDTQSGHHNGDIPVPLDAIERIEILLGPGSSLYGADAFGGTINVITRRSSAYRSAGFSGGSNGYVAGQAAMAGTAGRVHEAFAISAERSGGFEIDRDYRDISAHSSTTFGNGVRLNVSALGKDFGANGFYGPALSTERTNQTLVSADGQLRRFAGWDARWQTGYRTHGDVFLYNSVAGGTPNRHRTHAFEGMLRASHAFSDTTRLTLGGDAGVDWIRSNNLGDHSLARGSAYGELQQRVAARTVVYAGLRLDGYSTFGPAWSPSASAATWLGARVKLRASAARAFRVPTFTERFYVDPNNLGTANLTPERAWGYEGGADWLAPAGAAIGVTVFDRRDRDTIDFVRESALVRWRAANIRRVDTAGLELTARIPLSAAATASASYTRLRATTDSLPLLSKYVLDSARQNLALTGRERIRSMEFGETLRYTERRDGRTYWVADARASRAMFHAVLFVEGDNLLDSRYQEILGVDMPGRTFRAGITVGTR